MLVSVLRIASRAKADLHCELEDMDSGYKIWSSDIEIIKVYF